MYESQRLLNAMIEKLAARIDVARGVLGHRPRIIERAGATQILPRGGEKTTQILTQLLDSKKGGDLAKVLRSRPPVKSADVRAARVKARRAASAKITEGVSPEKLRDLIKADRRVPTKNALVRVGRPEAALATIPKKETALARVGRPEDALATIPKKETALARQAPLRPRVVGGGGAATSRWGSLTGGEKAALLAAVGVPTALGTTGIGLGAGALVQNKKKS
jgi:hypothetical protein